MSVCLSPTLLRAKPKKDNRWMRFKRFLGFKNKSETAYKPQLYKGLLPQSQQSKNQLRVTSFLESVFYSHVERVLH